MRVIISIISSLLVTSCLTQAPAPVEYFGNEVTTKAGHPTQNLESGKIESKPLLKKIETPYNEVTESSMPEEEPIQQISTKVKGNLESVNPGQNDTLENLSHDHDISIRALMAANNLKDPNDIKPGQKIIIPKIILHEVQSNEDINLIAEDYKQDVTVIAEVNNLAPPYLLSPNQILEIIVEPIINKKASTPQVSPEKNLKKQSSLSRPVAAGKIISKFKEGGKGTSEGIVIEAPQGEPVKASADGIVIYSGDKKNYYGNIIMLKHANNIFTAYAHLKDLEIKVGQKVKEGQIIGHVGSSGNVKKPQLFFVVRTGKKAVDPELYFSKL